MARIHRIFPKKFPESWASDWGEDDYGLFMGLTYKGVRQDFRWIEPGTFMMGSPNIEPERSNDELYHEVILTTGFWLADTTVTQALWETVMQDNPSEFKRKNLPVDSVSWEDTQKFIIKVNSLKLELNISLPTEEQWEYCCRAGSTTPFYFGKQINSSLVNYDGAEPYNKGKKSDYRQHTVQVKSLPPNAWGLYEMHGNVWEWCQDFYGNYSLLKHRSAKIEKTSHRVLRGGSWIDSGRLCRSASRFHFGSSYRRYYYGFRLALSNREVAR